MEDISLEKYIKNSPTPISIKGMETILFQMKNCVCKIHKNIGTNGSGFFCKIPYPGKSDLLPVLITNYHVLNEEDIKNNKIIELTINDDNEKRSIKIDENRIKFNSKELDVTFIEIKQNRDNKYI